MDRPLNLPARASRGGRRPAAMPAAMTGALLALAILFLASTPFAQTDPPQRAPFEFRPMKPGGTAAPVLLSLSPSPGGDEATSLQAYDVSDLTHSVQGAAFSAEAISTEDMQLAETRLAQLEDMESRKKHALEALAALEEVVRLSIQPVLRDGQDDLRILGDNLMVLQASAQHQAWLRKFLETQRTADTLISMKASIWTAPHGFAEALQLGVQGETQRLLETRSDVSDVRMLIAGLGSESVAAPELLTYPRQRATVSITNQTSYVSEWRLVHVAPAERPIADPVIDVVQEGVVLEARAVPLAPALWSVQINVQLSHLQRPIATQRVKFGDGSWEEEISLPVVTTVGMTSRFTSAAGGGALFLTYDSMNDQDIVLLLQVDDYDPVEVHGEK